MAKKFSSYSTKELFSEYAKEWLGATNDLTNFGGLNSRAGKISEHLEARLGSEKWSEIENGFINKSDEVREKILKKNPEYAGTRGIDIKRRAKAIYNELVNSGWLNDRIECEEKINGR